MKSIAITLLLSSSNAIRLLEAPTYGGEGYNNQVVNFLNDVGSTVDIPAYPGFKMENHYDDDFHNNYPMEHLPPFGINGVTFRSPEE
jgi:hypothetical protein